MADIKTRQSNKGTIRTIDRASAMTSHVKDVHARTKEEMLHSRDQGEKQESSQATDQMGRSVERSARTAMTYGADAAKAGYRQIRSKESVLQRQAEQKMAEKEVAREVSVIRTREKAAFASKRQRVSRRPVRTVRKPAGTNIKMMRSSIR